MGFLKRFLKNVFRDGQTQSARSSFDNLTEEQLEAHMKVTQYGDFMLTDAIRPSFDLQVVPTAGYRHDVYLQHTKVFSLPMSRKHQR